MEHLSLEVLRTFIFVVELNGFNKAALKVHRSESAVSMQMKKLEEVVGHELFERKGKKHSLTNHGEILLSYAKKILDLNDDVLTVLKEAKLKGIIRIGIQQDFAESLFLKTIFRFKKNHPDVVIDLKVETSDALQEYLSHGKLDVILYLAKEKKPDLNSTLLRSFQLKWIYSPENFQLIKNNFPIPLVVLGPNCKIRQAASMALNNAGISWRIAFSSSSLTASWEAITVGLGISARTTVGLPKHLKFIPKSFSLPMLGSVNAFLCTKVKEDSNITLTLKKYLIDSIENKDLRF